MKIYTWKGALISTGLVYLLPLIISATYKYADIGSIGPMVLLYCLLAMPFLIIIYSKALRVKFQRILSVILGIICSATMTILLLNYFMLVTYVFGIYDYQPM